MINLFKKENLIFNIKFVWFYVSIADSFSFEPRLIYSHILTFKPGFGSECSKAVLCHCTNTTDALYSF